MKLEGEPGTEAAVGTAGDEDSSSFLGDRDSCHDGRVPVEMGEFFDAGVVFLIDDEDSQLMPLCSDIIYEFGRARYILRGIRIPIESGCCLENAL